MKILFLVPYPLKESPSQRFRFEQYFQILENRGYHITIQSFFNSQEWKLFYHDGNSLQKFIALFKGFAKRFKMIFSAFQYEFIFIHREAAPAGPPVFEWVLANALRKKIIYDFDDAIWLTDRNHENWILKTIKFRSKVTSICKWSYRVSCGNDYLNKFAQQYNPSTMVIPTTIDTEGLHNRNKFKSTSSVIPEIIIGWTGSHSTLKYLKLLETILQKIETKYPFVSFLIIADKRPDLALKRLSFKAWDAETEVVDLMKLDIGIMPLPDDEWSKGKCGFKALQYLALEIPAVVSDVGVNSKIISQGVEGFLCQTEADWQHALELLINNTTLRAEMGARGRKKVVENYSVLSNSAAFISLFE